MAIFVVYGTLIIRVTLRATSGRQREGRNHVGIRTRKSIALVERDHWGTCICLQNPEAEVDLHSVGVTPSARAREP